jgi:hypothetical protein
MKKHKIFKLILLVSAYMPSATYGNQYFRKHMSEYDSPTSRPTAIPSPRPSRPTFAPTLSPTPTPSITRSGLIGVSVVFIFYVTSVVATIFFYYTSQHSLTDRTSAFRNTFKSLASSFPKRRNRIFRTNPFKRDIDQPVPYTRDSLTNSTQAI